MQFLRRVPKELLDITRDVTYTDNVHEMNVLCSEVIEEDFYNILAYWYKKVQNDKKSQPLPVFTFG